MKTRRGVVAGVAFLVVATACMQSQLQAQAGGKAAPARCYFDAARDGMKPAEVQAELWALQQHRALSFEETMDLAMSLFMQQQWERAAGIYQSAASSADKSAKKAAAMTGAAECLAAAQNWTEAGRLMNEANRLVPQAKPAAALRFAYWQQAGDALETRIAADRMAQLNLASDGKVVCIGPHDIPCVIAVWDAVIRCFRERRAPTQEEVARVAGPLFILIYDVADTTITRRLSPT